MPRGQGSPVVSAGLRQRRTFAKIPEILEVPNLIDIQRQSFDWFLNEGLNETFSDISPIEDFTGNLAVEFGGHEFGDPKYDQLECRARDLTFSRPLYVDVELVIRRRHVVGRRGELVGREEAVEGEVLGIRGIGHGPRF